MAQSLSNAMLVTTADNSDFRMIVGISDSSTYGEDFPSWNTPPSYQQKCYMADMNNPAADISGQAATGLAMAAKVLKMFGTAADGKAARKYTQEAARAYEYTKTMWRKNGINSICSRSSATNNCIGSGCTEIEEDTGNPVRSVCCLKSL